MTARRWAAAALAAALLVALAPAASAAAPRVRLRAERSLITAGQEVLLRGRVSPTRPGARVRIVDGAGEVRARVRTARDGRFRVRLSPRRSVALRARWRRASSPAVRVRVRPRLVVGIRRVRLFARARVRGRVGPRHPGRAVRVRLWRNGKLLRRRTVDLVGGRRFRASFRIRRPGRYRAGATFRPSRGTRARDSSRSHRTRMPRLARGAHGVMVGQLEKRLVRLGYLLFKVNRRFDGRTEDAVRAFHKVQGRSRSGIVREPTWRALAHPRKPRPRRRKPGFHIEIDQTKQVLYVVRRGRVKRILHTSTGANGVTRDGVWTVHRKLAGYSPNRLYYPSYFDGLRAIHGWPDVPVTPASHGCARVPMWAAVWIYRRADIGTQVRIYH
ncbi:MAG TPA: L,D-transpeptidase family protein [Actinomycetota bacterium]|nr:L,D-transpeptidase family protein [Actinomycetota bacterium]